MAPDDNLPSAAPARGLPALGATTTLGPQHPFNVVLFGWADGEPSHIAKYQSAYPPGCDFFIMPSVVWDMGKDPRLLIHQADPIIEFLSQHGHIGSCNAQAATSGRGLVLHAFSNGGVQSLAILLARLAATNSCLVRLSGLILDCAPTPTAQRAIYNGADLYSYSLGFGPLPTAIARRIFFTGMSLQTLIARMCGWRPQINKNRDMLLGHTELSGVPKLVMYTPGDRFINHRHIEWLIGRMATQMMRGDVNKSLPNTSAASVGGGSLDDFRVFTMAAGNLTAVPRSTSVPKDGQEDPSRDLVALQRKNRTGPHGGLLAAVRFPSDALHVQLLRGYPKQYVRVVGAFLAKL